MLAESDKLNFGNRVPESGFDMVSLPDIISSVDTREDVARNLHEAIEIKLYTEGSSTLIIGNKTITTSPGDVVVINPYEFHSTVDIGETRGVYHFFMIGLDFFDDCGYLNLRQIFIKERTKICSLIKKDERIISVLKNIVSEIQAGKNFYQNVVMGLVLEFFSLLLRDYKLEEQLELPEDKNLRYYELIYPAINKIRKDYAEKINIDELAAMCCISKYHFCRIFKEVTSFSPASYHMEYRIRIADILLKNSNKSISEIAEQCGFEDAAYFSRCYKKNMGISPRKKRAILSK